MRIRKNASKILGSSSSYSSSAAAAPLLLPPPRPAPELLQKCELNQSPWDVMSFPLPPSSPQKMGDDGDDGLERDVSMKATRANKKRAVSRKKAATTDHNGSTVPTCKKMDEKRWNKCKKAAQPPHALCDNHHLTQLKSYSTDNVLPSQDHRPRSKKRQKVSSAATGSDSGFYYYYSGFGPWRGKKRGGSGGGNMNGTTAVTVKEEGQEDHEKEEDQEQVRLQEAADDDDEEDSLDEESEEEDQAKQQQQQQQQQNNPRRRRRRKARSLKSLL